MSKKICLLRRPAEIVDVSGSTSDCTTHIHITKTRAAELCSEGAIEMRGENAAVVIKHTALGDLRRETVSTSLWPHEGRMWRKRLSGGVVGVMQLVRA